MPTYEDGFRIEHGAVDVISNLNTSHRYVPQASVDYWWARDLMLSAGYGYVDDIELERCVGYAVVCLTSSDIDPRYHICRYTRHFHTIRTGGYDRNDYFLSRYASYWVAQSLPFAMPYRRVVIDYLSCPEPDPFTHRFSVLNKQGWPVTEITDYLNQNDLHNYRRFSDASDPDSWPEYIYMSPFDLRTFRPCRELDGRIFSVSDAVPGVNFPPMHPGCISTTAPINKRDILYQLERCAKDPIDKTSMRLPPMSNYYTWFNILIEKYGEKKIREARDVARSELSTFFPKAL